MNLDVDCSKLGMIVEVIMNLYVDCSKLGMIVQVLGQR